MRNHRANSAFSSPDVIGVGEEDSDFEDVAEGTAASSRIAQQFPGACRRPAFDRTVQHRIKRARPTNVLFCRGRHAFTLAMLPSRSGIRRPELLSRRG